MTPDGMLALLFSSSLGVDIALGFIGLEFAYLLWRCPSEARYSKIGQLILALGPGVCLMMALRCALTGADAAWIAVWLLASLPLHLTDVLRRKL